MPNNNAYMARYISDRYLRLKIKAVKYKGGECQNCGYDKCYAALEFHHRNSQQKEASWSTLRKLSWRKIQTELDKCDLLCANCHRELHFDPELLRAMEKRHEARQREAIVLRCKHCQRDFHGSRKRQFCSQGCARESKERIDWPDDLPQLVQSTSLRAVGRLLGVSDKAVKKRLCNHYPAESP